MRHYMIKRLKLDEFVSLMGTNGISGKEMKKSAIKTFAEVNGVSVPVAFWKTYDASRRGYYMIPLVVVEEEPEDDTVSIETALSDDDFDIAVSTPDGGLIKVIKVTDKVSGQTMETSVHKNASQETINNAFKYFQKRLRNL